MPTPSATDVLDALQASLDASWTDPNDLFGTVRNGDAIWMRASDDDPEVIRITVEKLPRDQWPPMPRG